MVITEKLNFLSAKKTPKVKCNNIINETIDLRTGYSLGFADLDDSGVDNSSVKTNGVFLKVGYLFGDY